MCSQSDSLTVTEQAGLGAAIIHKGAIMGHSTTYHLVGQSDVRDTESGGSKCWEYPAMTLTEAAQMQRRSGPDGTLIVRWFAQTARGRQLLGADMVLSADMRFPVLVDCPICKGKGCVVCNFSGICRSGHWRKWQDWQLANIAAAGV